jgi:hypothetical protein
VAHGVGVRQSRQSRGSPGSPEGGARAGAGAAGAPYAQSDSSECKGPVGGGAGAQAGRRGARQRGPPRRTPGACTGPRVRLQGVEAPPLDGCPRHFTGAVSAAPGPRRRRRPPLRAPPCLPCCASAGHPGSGSTWRGGAGGGGSGAIGARGGGDRGQAGARARARLRSKALFTTFKGRRAEPGVPARPHRARFCARPRFRQTPAPLHPGGRALTCGSPRA